MNAIQRLVSPRSVAVIGASADPAKTSGRPVSYLRKHGFAGAIYPVNPKVESIDGLRCYPDVASLPEVPDVGIVLLARSARTVRCARWPPARGHRAGQRLYRDRRRWRAAPPSCSRPPAACACSARTRSARST